jgi:hypothetical protein
VAGATIVEMGTCRIGIRDVAYELRMMMPSWSRSNFIHVLIQTISSSMESVSHVGKEWSQMITKLGANFVRVRRLTINRVKHTKTNAHPLSFLGMDFADRALGELSPTSIRMAAPHQMTKRQSY